MPGGDEATLYPDLWLWCVATLGVRRVLDIGCGDGAGEALWRDAGASVWLGVEGVDQPNQLILTHDYTFGPLEFVAHDFDLGWCCEVVEHIEARYLPNLASTFQRCRYVMLTHAFPGQGGHHHVNCQPPAYWVGAMAAFGFTLDNELTTTARAVSAINQSMWNHFVRSGLVFSRAR